MNLPGRAGAGGPALLAKSTRKPHGVHAAHSRRLWRVPQISPAEPSPATGLVTPLPRRVGRPPEGPRRRQGRQGGRPRRRPPRPGPPNPPPRGPSLRGGGLPQCPLSAPHSEACLPASKPAPRTPRPPGPAAACRAPPGRSGRGWEKRRGRQTKAPRRFARLAWAGRPAPRSQRRRPQLFSCRRGDKGRPGGPERHGGWGQRRWLVVGVGSRHLLGSRGHGGGRRCGLARWRRGSLRLCLLRAGFFSPQRSAPTHRE